MRIRTTGLSAVFILAALGVPAHAASNSLTGSIVGMVSNALGIPQMGASVTLFNRVDREVARTLTDDRGHFQFESLPSDRYSVRVTLASFLPALHGNIGVQPGIRKVLEINLAGVLSTIELVYSLPVQQGLMSDDWKWTLRGSLATRPILRFLPAERVVFKHQSGLFSQTRGMVRISAGDATPAPTLGSQPDLGTAFALATSLYGSNRVEVSGNVGYGAASGNPAAGFRTTYSRRTDDSHSPEVAVTMRQMLSSPFGRSDSMPVLRTMSVGVTDRIRIAEHLLISYGATMESVQYLQRLNYVSPFARVTYDAGPAGTIDFGFSSGLPPIQLYKGASAPVDADEQQQLASLALFPRVSVRGGSVRVQRAQNFEAGYSAKIGKRTLTAGAYHESFSNAALTAISPGAAFGEGEMLPDMFSTASIFNAGNYSTVGYMASVAQPLTENWTVTFAYGNSGVLEATHDELTTQDANELRSLLQTRGRHWATTLLAGNIPLTGTRFTTSYQFMNGRALTPGHYYITQRITPGQGLNVNIRQPLPAFGGMSGKLEATAEVRNFLAQGYQPIHLQGGQRIQLVHSPRALRGGLAFIF
ncbi:MAG TPA: carboxypeptidase-like regulatory domain-containing protein [Bryobacteraceae bacterium]|nr:carboxypeptidase-like regulatory domain-containing protein [Bryobacteraceae bacterium]